MEKPTHPRIYLSPPHMGEWEMKYINEAFSTNWISPLGPNVEGFEKEMADYIGTKGASAVSSGTAALHLALRLAGVERGDTVFCSSFTFIGSANPILYQSATPVYIDSCPENWNLCPQTLRKALKSAAERKRLPKAIVVASLYGQSADMTEIGKIADEYSVTVIEDAAESLGAVHRGKKSGSFGRFNILSFNGNKIITTSGGGMLVSDDLKALEKSRFWATQARDPSPHYQHSEMGFNYRMSNVLAGIGRGQMRVLEERVSARRSIFERYQTAFADLPFVKFMPELPGDRGTRWLSTFTLDPSQCTTRPMDIIGALAAENIEARPLWKPLHLQPLFKDIEYIPYDSGYSVCDRLFENGMCLPSGSALTRDEQERVIGIVRRSMGV